MTTGIETYPAPPPSSGPARANRTAESPPSVGDRIHATQSEVGRFSRWVEFTVAIVLSLATVATAWSGYQAVLWGGEQVRYMAAATAANVQSAQQTDSAQQK